VERVHWGLNNKLPTCSRATVPFCDYLKTKAGPQAAFDS
jgi:hypothetical protein